MTNTKITAESFLDSKELREQAMERAEVLDKVKQLFLIPELECMTGTQVADYFEVEFNTIQQQYQRNKSEFDEDGTVVKSIADFKKPKLTGCQFRQSGDKNGVTILCFENGTEIKMSNRGIRCYPKRAVLRMGMLLRDSRVAKEVRTRLLNTFEHATVEQRTAEIDKEEDLVGSIIKSALKGETQNVLTTFTDYIGYKNRYIAKIEQHNAELAQENAKISEQKEKVEQANKDLVVENDFLAKDILKWTDRSSANRLVRVIAGKCFKSNFEYAFNTIYKDLAYKYGISVSVRKKRDNNRKPKIAYIKDNEWIYLYKVAVAICNQNHLNVKSVFEDAKIDTSGLRLE